MIQKTFNKYLEIFYGIRAEGWTGRDKGDDWGEDEAMQGWVSEKTM